ncbi:MAG: carotenoid biosynthesis protein [Deinococcota bacterium]
MTYLQFHAIFVLPPLVLLILWALYDVRRGWPLAGKQVQAKRAQFMLGLNTLIAITYTTPWDNYLVATGVWTYGRDRVLGTIGYVPVEEYAFFVLQTILTGLWLYMLRRYFPSHLETASVSGMTVSTRADANKLPNQPQTTTTHADSMPTDYLVRFVGALFLLGLSASGVLATLLARGTYYGLITMWAGPVLALMWALGGDVLWRNREQVALAVLVPTLYLSAADLVAIYQDIWAIRPATSSGFMLFGLPFEEALFFLLTNMLVVFGLTLSLTPSILTRLIGLVQTARRGSWWRLVLVEWGLSMIPTPLVPSAFERLILLSTVLLAVGVFGYTWANFQMRALLLLGVAFGFGVIVEFIGYQTGFPFGQYAYTTNAPSILGVPIIVPLGWFAFTLIALSVSPVKGRLWIAPWALVAWDIGLDPLMVNRGVWAFAEGRYYGIPLSNFIGWYAAGVGLVWLLMKLEPRLARARSLSLQVTFAVQTFLFTIGLIWFGLPLAALCFLLAMGSVLALSDIPLMDVLRPHERFTKIRASNLWQNYQTRFKQELDVWIARMLPWVIRRSLRRNLQGVWVRGELTALRHTRPLILALNHHSWWDAYGLWLLREKLAVPVTTIMADWQLEKFSFFRHEGVISQREIRRAIRAVQAGELLAIFPEGEICPAGQVGELKRGVQFLAERTGAAICPVVMRTVMRGGQYPDMIVDIGTPVTGSSQEMSLQETLQQAFNNQLAEIDSLVLKNDPEAPLPGFDLWFQGQSSFHTRVGWLAKLRKLAGQYSSEDSLNDGDTMSDSSKDNLGQASTLSAKDISAVKKTNHTSREAGSREGEVREAKVASENTESTTYPLPKGVAVEKTMSSETVSSKTMPAATSQPQPDAQHPQPSPTYDQPAMTPANDPSS